ncbi:Adenine specific DNA methylase Mod [Citrobacter koseri]|nr:Adenine specific DNA methylase Mod [Citrobacter koseri]
MIYIDPPYNTGKDFVYKDNFKDNIKNYKEITGQVDGEGRNLFNNPETSGRYHTDWLNMMYPRLKLARNLLKDDGAIFISIDENEITNLRKLCDEVFGEDNFLGTIANVNNPKGRSDDKFIATAHEYIVIYSKNIVNASTYGFDPDEKITKRYNKVDSVGKVYREIDLRKTGDSDRREDRPDMFYYFYFDESTGALRVSKEKLSRTDSEIEIYPVKDDGSEGRWRWGFTTALQKIDSVYAKFMPARKIWGIFEKDYLEGRPPVKSTSTWAFKDVNSERGSEQFIDLGFDKEVFQRPKPVGTLRRVLEVGTIPGEPALVIDFLRDRVL